MCKILTHEETRRTAWVRGHHPPSSGVCGAMRNQLSQARAQGSHRGWDDSAPGAKSGPGQVEVTRERSTEGFLVVGAGRESSVTGGLGR